MIKSVKIYGRIAVQSSVIAMVFFAWSCSKHEKVPEGILTQDKMVAVMSELYVAEQKISTLGVKRDSLAQIFDVLKDKIFTKAGTSDSVFRKSLDYYMDHPQNLEVIYTALVDSLNLREQRVLSGQLR